MIHPCSSWRFLWVLTSLFFLACDVFMLSMSMFELQRSMVLDIFDVIYWSLDLLMNFRTGVYRKVGGLDMDPRSVACHYLTTWFALDISVVVFQWILLVVDASSAGNGASFIRYMRITRIVKLLRLAKLDGLVANVLERIQSLFMHLLVKMGLYMLCVVLWVHLSACLWYWIGLADNGWVEEHEQYREMPLNYWVSAHWAVTQLQGNSDLGPTFSVGERAFAVWQVLASIVVLAGLISRLTTVMQTIQKSNSQRRRLMDGARSYCLAHDISRDLFLRVRKYIERQQLVEEKQFHNRSEIELLQLLPKNLARELLMEARSPVLMKQLLFIALTRFCPRFFERLCCDLLQASCVMPNESIYTQGVVAKCMFVVAAGDTSLFTYGFVWQALSSGALRGSQNQSTGVIFDRQKEMKSQILNEGTVVCEPTLWVRWVHCGDFDSISQAGHSTAGTTLHLSATFKPRSRC